jgi:hypothetical protein
LGTSRFVIIRSLAVFDGVKAKDLPAAPNLMRETRRIYPRDRG